MPFFGGGGGGGLYQVVPPAASNNIKGGENSMVLVTGTSNLALHNAALQDITVGSNNIGIGVSAGQNVVDGDRNVLIGNNAGETLTSGSENTIIGDNCGSSIFPEHVQNVLIGYNVASVGNGYANYCVFIGANCASNLNDSENTVCVGASAGDYSTLLDNAVILGQGAGYSGNTLNNVVLIGKGAGQNNLSLGSTNAVTNSVILGSGAISHQANGHDLTLQNSIVIGDYALSASGTISIDGAIIIGRNNTTNCVADISNSISIGTGISVTGQNQIKIGDSSHVGTVEVGPYNLAKLGPSYTWATLPAGSAGNVVWCSDYPGPIAGCELIYTGSRWRPVGQRRTLLSYLNGTTGLVFAAAAAEALFGDSILLKGGMLIAGDKLRITLELQQAAASDAVARVMRIRSATTLAGLLAGASNALFNSVSTVNTIYSFDKTEIILDNTTGKSSSSGFPSGIVTTSSANAPVITDLSADSYWQLSFVNGSNQAVTIFNVNVTAEFST